MKRISLFLCLTMLVCLLAQPLAAAASYEGADAAEPAAYDGYIVKLTKPMPMRAMALLDDAIAGEPCWDTGDGSYLVVDSVEEAEQIPPEYVDYIEPNYILTLYDQPNDPLYGTYQWNMQTIGMESVYDLGLDGSGVKIAFVDSGIFKDHEDLNPALISGANFAADQKAYTDDVTGHGTFAAGIVAAQTENEKGLAGVAPGAEIIAYRAFDAKTTTTDIVVAAIKAAVDDGCDILNLSLGGSSSTTLQGAIDYAEKSGVVMVAAVGNSGSTVLNYPAAYTSVIGVGSVKSNLNCSSFSNKNNSVFVTAPGESVYSLSCLASDQYMSSSGTSFSAPVVSGLAALALGYDNDITPDGIRYLLEKTSKDYGAVGYDTQYGYGVVNAAAFAEELTRSFELRYVLNDGLLPEDAPLSYSVTDDTFSLPTPTRTGYAFAGWYEASDLRGAQTVEIQAGSLGDRTLFAAWYTEDVFAVKSVMVDGVPAAWQDDNGGYYLAVLPFGTDLSKLTIGHINAVAAVTGSNASAAKSIGDDSGASWTITVSSDTASKEYALRIETIQLHVQAGQENQTGTATPMSLDGNVEPSPYTADAQTWFTWGDGPIAPFSVFTCAAEVEKGKGTVSVDGFTVSYTPSQEDAGHDALINVYGETNGVRTLDAVLLTVQVAPLPFSQPVAEDTANYDLYAKTGPELTLSLFDNQITEVSINGVTLSAVHYTLPEITVDGKKILTLSHAAIADLSPGNHTVSISFNAGSPCIVTLALTDSTPPKDPPKVDPPKVEPPKVEPADTYPVDTEAPIETQTPPDDPQPVESETEPAWENPFADVGQNDWFYEDVQYALQSGLFNGTGGDTFSPNTPLNRAMAVTVLYRLYLPGEPEESFGTSGFSDVPTGAYYSSAVPWAAEAGIVTGYDSTHFGPDDTITRQDFAVMLMRYIRLTELDYIVTQEYVSFADEDEIAAYAKEAMQTLYKLGIINGVGENRVAPGTGVTRAQAAAMLHRLTDKMLTP